MIASIEINGLLLGQYVGGYLFTRLSGFGFPEVRVDIQNRGNYHGAALGMHKFGRRIMTIEGYILGTTAEDYDLKRRLLSSALNYDGGLVTTKINTRAGLVLQAETIASTALDMPYQSGRLTRGDFRIELVAPYPFLVGQNEQTISIPAFSGGGTEIPAEMPMSLANGDAGAQEISNSGNANIYPIIKIYGAIENPSISNETTGETLSLTYDLANGDYIEIDVYNRTVLLNGTSNIRGAASGDWLILAPGANSIRTSAVTYDDDARTEIIYRDSYLGI